MVRSRSRRDRRGDSSGRQCRGSGFRGAATIVGAMTRFLCWKPLNSCMEGHCVNKASAQRVVDSPASGAGTGERVKEIARQISVSVHQLHDDGAEAVEQPASDAVVESAVADDCAQFGLDTDHGAFQVCAVSFRAEAAQGGSPRSRFLGGLITSGARGVPRSSRPGSSG